MPYIDFPSANARFAGQSFILILYMPKKITWSDVSAKGTIGTLHGKHAFSTSQSLEDRFVSEMIFSGLDGKGQLSVDTFLRCFSCLLWCHLSDLVLCCKEVSDRGCVRCCEEKLEI